jgi:hypothetical protein
MNVVVLRGQVAGEIGWFESRAGVRIAGFDVATVPHDGGAKDIVPVSWADPPAWADELAAGDVIVVRGRVRKRFARSGGGMRPFTDVVAAQVVKASRRAGVQRLLNDAADALVDPQT